MNSTFYITTAIDYPNAAPHMGHLYEKIVTDCYARWMRWSGKDVWFVTGTDENGQKLAKAASEAGVDTRIFVDEIAQKFRQMCVDFAVTNDDFIRTTEKRHQDCTAEIWRKLADKNLIYFGAYSGNYCLACEAFYTESQAPEGLCPHHGGALESVSQEGYFFAMSKFCDWIQEHIQNHRDFIFPESARREILSRLAGDELRDLSVSRPNEGWGIPVPGDPKHVIYTWFDALINYYAAVYNEPSRKKYWPAAVHVVGKDITWFHTVIWPIMLHAAEIELPRQIYVHGMVLAADGRKMSKSLNNVVDPYSLYQQYPLDSVRYCLLRSIPSGGDGRFAVGDLIDRHNNELANDFGNVALRVIKLAIKRLGQKVERQNVSARFDGLAVYAEVSSLMDQREHHKALDRLWEFVNSVNALLNQTEPWRIKDDPTLFHDLIYNSLYAIYVMAELLTPFIPDAAAKTLTMLGQSAKGPQGLTFGEQTFEFGEPVSMFPKIEVT